MIKDSQNQIPVCGGHGSKAPHCSPMFAVLCEDLMHIIWFMFGDSKLCIYWMWSWTCLKTVSDSVWMFTERQICICFIPLTVEPVNIENAQNFTDTSSPPVPCPPLHIPGLRSTSVGKSQWMPKLSLQSMHQTGVQHNHWHWSALDAYWMGSAQTDLDSNALEIPA